MNDAWVFGLLFSASHLFFGLGIAWVWAFSSLTWPMSLFILYPWVDWCSCHATVLLLLWYHLSFCLVITSGLTSWSTYHVNFLHYSFFWSLLPNIPARPIHFVPWASSAHFILWASSAHFILPYLFHSYRLLLNPLDFASPITTSLPLGLLTFEPIPFTNSFLWAFPSYFYFLSISYNSHRPTTSFFWGFLGPFAFSQSTY